MNDIAIDKEHLHYLEQLSEMYPTIGKASSEIINLQAILNLPKGTEHFVSDVHGEYEAFSHVLKNGSGAVRKKIDDVFGLAMNKADKAALATLIYYPREKMELIKQDEPDMDSWYKTTLYKLIEVCKTVSSKYTRSKVRKALPEEYAYVIEELITEKPEVLNKEAYYESIINTTVELGTAEEFIVVLSELIQRLAVDHLHVLGDIYDRGAGPHTKIIDILLNARKKYAYGDQVDYFDHPSTVGFIRTGDGEHVNSGLVFLISNDEAGSKTMCLGKEHAGEVWCEITGSIPDEVTLDKEGNGEFSVDARNLAVWVKKA